MPSLISLEFRKLLSSRSTRLALIVCGLLPFLWSVAPRLGETLNVTLVSGWQLPAISIGLAVQYLMPLFIAIAVAELLGTEVAQGTLAPLLLRPVSRSQVILSKLLVALTLPFLLVAVTFIGALLAGLPIGYGPFSGGTGFGPGGFVGLGEITPDVAVQQLLRGALLSSVMLMPIAALALLFGALFLNTAAAALATLVTLIVMRLLTVFPAAVQRLMLTNYTNLYAIQGDVSQTLTLLAIYTIGFSLMAIFAFDRRDV